jgi:hypothetical protein
MIRYSSARKLVCRNRIGHRREGGPSSLSFTINPAALMASCAFDISSVLGIRWFICAVRKHATSAKIGCSDFRISYASFEAVADGF